MYTLMNKDVPVIAFDLRRGTLGTDITELKRYDAPVPVGMTSVEEWLSNRKASKHNAHLRRLMSEMGCDEPEGFIRITHATAITDSFWVKKDSENISWKDISLYDNEFNEVVSKLAFEGVGIPDEQFSTTSPELTTDGSFRKAFTRENDTIYLFKRGSSGASNAGLEPYCEVMASELAQKICSDAVKYDLITLHGELASRCRLFTDADHGYVPYSRYISQANGISPDTILNFYAKTSDDSPEHFREMLVLDAVILNPDRHLSNFGVMVDNDSQRPLKMAPVFDLNLSLLPYVTKEEFNDIGEKMLDYGPQIGNDFIEIGQAAMTDAIRDKLKSLEGFRFSFRGDDVFPAWRVQKMEEIVNKNIEALLSPQKLTTRQVFVPRHEAEYESQRRQLKVAEQQASDFYDKITSYSGVMASIEDDSSHCSVIVEPDPPFDDDFYVNVDFMNHHVTAMLNGQKTGPSELVSYNSQAAGLYARILESVNAMQEKK